MARRNKSNLVASQGPKEPETGPGSATCFCRRMERRMKAEEARQTLRAEACGLIAPSDGPKFADFQIISLESLDEFYEAVRARVQAGLNYRVRVAVL